MRFSYRRLTVLLRREGWLVNAKQVYLIYKEEGLMIRTNWGRKSHREGYSWLNWSRPRFSAGEWIPWRPRLEDGRPFWILTMVDQFTPECLAIRGKPRLNGSDVAEALDMAVRERGKPASNTVDNSSEFAGKVMGAWADARAVHLAFIRPGKPTESAFTERFKGTQDHPYLVRTEAMGFASFSALCNDDFQRKIQIRSKDWQ